jgi:hypothetical protein
VGVSLGDTITCSATATDPEGDIPTIDYQWTNATTNTVVGSLAVLTVDPAIATGGDELVCTVIAEDDYSATATQSTSIVVGSSEPVFTVAASISPNSGVVSDSVLTCTGTAADPDGGSISYSHEWYNQTQNTMIGSSTSISLDSSMVSPTDSLE